MIINIKNCSTIPIIEIPEFEWERHL